jgi:hypothetical protein
MFDFTSVLDLKGNSSSLADMTQAVTQLVLKNCVTLWSRLPLSFSEQSK